MRSVHLNSDWSVTAGDEHYVCDLPHDVTANAVRDFACAFGEYNGYVPAAKATFTAALPQIKHDFAELYISGACGFGDVYVNDQKVGTLCGASPDVIPLNDFDECLLAGAHNTLRLELVSAPGMSDKYLGLGIAGGVKLLVSDRTADIVPNSLFVRTTTVGGRTYADCELSVYNYGADAQKFVIECTALNARGKRAGKKQRRVFVRAGQRKKISVRVRMNNPYEWSTDDPYVYTMNVKLVTAEGEERPATTRFGIVTRSLNSTRGLYINNRNTLLFGAYVAPTDAALGSVSLYCNEKRRLEALKSVGYNAVHYVGCPTDAVLDACDDVGMYAFVDLCAELDIPKAPLSGIMHNIDPFDKIYALRNHPSVTVYGIADDVPECYGRGEGHSLIAHLAEDIRGLDDTRPITVSAHEFVPTAKEFETAGYKKTRYENEAAAKNAGREKNMFDDLTAGAFDSVDVCGFNYLFPLYELEKLKRDRLILGARTSSDRAFDSIDATGKNSRVIGDFNDCGIDYLGGGKLNEIITTCGDLDCTCAEKPQAVYKRILLGSRNIAYITAVDPDSGEDTEMWNWPRYLGQKITVRVYTSGDVVALYLDGRLVGRRLAGKVNKHIAEFGVDYYPGTLEAVSYFKGVECARTRLKTAGSPKAIRLYAYDKNLSVSRGDVGFVNIEVCDRDGNLVPYAMRELEATVVSGGTLVGFINADPMLRKNAFDRCPAFGGRALAVVKPDPAENKVVIKITGDGLTSSKISFKIKN